MARKKRARIEREIELPEELRQSAERISQELEQYRADAEYFDRDYNSLREQYPDVWVAVYKNQVVGSNRDQKRLVRDLRKQGLPAGNIYMERTYFREKPPTLILPAYSTA